MENKTRELRAHHGMCMAFFEGKGYSDEFTAHMAKTIAGLQQNAVVRLVKKTDVVCEKCPHNQGNICDTAALVDGYDEGVLQRCGLRVGDEIPFAEFQKLVTEKIILTGEREKICGDCQWTEICHLKK